MSEYDYDLFVIGGGSGGVRAARVAASYGARVALAEEGRLGGTCVNLGCIPKKLFVYAAHVREEVEDAAGFGWDLSIGGFDWPRLVSAKDAEIARLNGIYQRILEGSGVRILPGRARLVDAHTVEVGGSHHTSRYILVAVGGWPRKPTVEGGELTVTSNEMFGLEALPKRALVVGGGYIAVEFAGILNGLGSEVTLVHRGDAVLRGFDDDLRRGLGEELSKKGIRLRLGTEVTRFEEIMGGIRAHASSGEPIDCDLCLCAIGRVPKTADLGLEQAGVALSPFGAIVVDDYLRTSVESIYAVGDATDRIQLTPVALAEGMAVAATLFDGRPTKPDHAFVPSAVFSQPPLATVGYTEEEARRLFGELDIYRSRFRPLKHTLSGRQEQTLMKIVVARADQRVVGIHVLGPDAAEIVQGFAVAVKLGAKKRDLDATIGIHPTAAEELVTMRTPIEG